MDRELHFEDHGECTLRVLRDHGMEASDLWVSYYGVGGQLDRLDIEAYLYGLMALPELEYLLLTEAVHELLAGEV